jgi:DNA repair exonuclease SbcCD ATPase subunit
MPKHVPRNRRAELHRIGALEDELKQRDARIRELRADLNKAEALISEEREHVEDADALIDAWIEAFDMMQGDDGWSFKDWVDDCILFKDKYLELLKEWNRFVPDYNAAVRPKPVGRPLAADEAQQRQVLKLHKRGMSLRKIAAEVQVPLNTVRTIIAKANGADRVTKKRWQKLHPGERWEERSYVPIGNEKLLKRIEVDRKAETAWRARKRTINSLPKRISETLTRGHELVRAARGLR